MGGDVYRDFQVQFTDAAGRYFVRAAAQVSQPIAEVVTAECRAAVLALRPDWCFADDVEIDAVANGFHGKVGSIAPEFTLRVSTTALKLRSLTKDEEQIKNPAKFLLTQLNKGLARKLEGEALAVVSVFDALPNHFQDRKFDK